MNIFIIDQNPVLCAQALDDLRLNKMILETGQMLCTGFRHYFPGLVNEYKDQLYKPTHINHPCNVWLREDIANYKWLASYFKELANERYYRLNKSHLTFDKLYSIVAFPEENLPVVKVSFDCTNICIYGSTIFERYKQCLRNKWNNDKRTPTWTKRGQPSWRFN